MSVTRPIARALGILPQWRFDTGRGLGVISGPAGYDPLTDSPDVYFDASDLSTLFQERTGASATTPAVADGVVGTILDKSGNAHHWTALSDTARPTLRDDGGGRYYLESNDVDSHLKNTSINFVTSEFYVLTAFEKVSVQNYERHLSFNSTGLNTHGYNVNSAFEVSTWANGTTGISPIQQSSGPTASMVGGQRGVVQMGIDQTSSYIAINDDADVTTSFADRGGLTLKRMDLFAPSRDTPSSHEYTGQKWFGAWMRATLPNSTVRDNLKTYFKDKANIA